MLMFSADILRNLEKCFTSPVEICRTKMLVKFLQAFYYTFQRKKMQAMEKYSENELAAQL